MKNYGWFGFILMVLSGCSSSPPVKVQEYAALPNKQVYEYEFPVVWKAIEQAFKDSVVLDRDPEDVNELDLKRLTYRTLKVDWIYGQSRDKYEEYKINGSPHKKYLQTRLKYQVFAQSVMGGTEVKVQATEEIERLKNDGTSDGFEKSDRPDPSRAHEILEKINQALLSAMP